LRTLRAPGSPDGAEAPPQSAAIIGRMTVSHGLPARVFAAIVIMSSTLSA
jgi:hypothetical protein